MWLKIIPKNCQWKSSLLIFIILLFSFYDEKFMFNLFQPSSSIEWKYFEFIASKKRSGRSRRFSRQFFFLCSLIPVLNPSAGAQCGCLAWKVKKNHFIINTHYWWNFQFRFVLFLASIIKSSRKREGINKLTILIFFCSRVRRPRQQQHQSFRLCKRSQIALNWNRADYKVRAESAHLVATEKKKTEIRNVGEKSK